MDEKKNLQWGYTFFYRQLHFRSEPGELLSYFRKWARNWAYPTCKNMFKWLLLIRAFISYQNIQEKSIILENSLKIWPKSQAEALPTELPIKKCLVHHTTSGRISLWMHLSGFRGLPIMLVRENIFRARTWLDWQLTGDKSNHMLIVERFRCGVWANQSHGGDPPTTAG